MAHYKESQTYYRHLESLGYNKTTRKQLPFHLDEFIDYIEKPILQTTKQDVLNYLSYLKERPNKVQGGGLSEHAIYHHLYALRVYFSWQLDLQHLTIDPTSSIRLPTPTGRPRAILTHAEVKELYQGCTNLKARALVSLGYGCGLRRTEIARLDLKDIHFSKDLLYVRRGKNDKRRVVPLSPRVKQDLWNYYLNERFSSGTDAFICTPKGLRYHPCSLNRLLKKALENTAIEKKISLHNLRHSIATHLIESGLSLEYVRDFLGHTFLETTQVYTRISKRQILQVC